MGVLVAGSDESVVISPNKSFQGTPKKLRFFSAPELKRYAFSAKASRTIQPNKNRR